MTAVKKSLARVYAIACVEAMLSRSLFLPKEHTATESSGWGQTRDHALSYKFVQGSCAVQNTQSLSRPIILGAQVEGSSTATRQKIAKHPTAL